MLVISAPSGAGKTSLARALVARNDRLAFSVSVTTRRPRPGEQDKKDYHFVDEATFDRMRREGALVEWAEVHGRYYGTPASEIAAILERGQIAVLDIDVQGARQIRARFEDAVLVFILPPSVSSLIDRLGKRASEDQEELRRRLATARSELPAIREFDYVVINDDFDDAVRDLEAIVAAENRRVARFPDVESVVRELDAGLIDLLERSG